MKKILSVLLAALMILGISVTAFAASEKTVRSAANLQTRQEQPQNRSKRKVITKQEKTEEKAQPKKDNGGVSVLQKTAKFSYGSFDYPQNALLKKADSSACDLSLQDKDGEEFAVVRLRAFDHTTAQQQEIVDENGLMYAMYSGFLEVSSMDRPASEAAKGIGSEEIRREVVTMLKEVTEQQGSYATSYTGNSKMGGIEIGYSDEETAERCIILHAEDYDYVLFGISDQKGASALDKMTELMASTLLEKRKI